MNASGRADGVSVFSIENFAMVWSLPLSKSRKSFWCNVPMAWPFESRTTTGTITRFTAVLKVRDESCVVISGAFCVCSPPDYARHIKPAQQKTDEIRNAKTRKT